MKFEANDDGSIDIQIPESLADFEGERLSQRINGLAAVSKRSIKLVVT